MDLPLAVSAYYTKRENRLRRHLAARLGAILTGLPSVLFVLVGLHWAGALLAIVLSPSGALAFWRGLEVSRA